MTHHSIMNIHGKLKRKLKLRALKKSKRILRADFLSQIKLKKQRKLRNNVINETNIASSDLLKLQEILSDMMTRLVEEEENPSAIIRSSIISLEEEIKKLDKDREIITAYLTKNYIPITDAIFSSILISKDFENKTDSDGIRMQ